jgi:transposase
MKVTNLLKGRKGQKGRKCKYDIALKRKVVSDYMNGNQSTTQLGQYYNIPHQSISRWAKQFSSELVEETNIQSMTEQEQEEMTNLQKQLKSLQDKLEYEQMKNFALETMVDLAKSELGIDLRKNSGAKQPKE